MDKSDIDVISVDPGISQNIPSVGGNPGSIPPVNGGTAPSGQNFNNTVQYNPDPLPGSENLGNVGGYVDPTQHLNTSVLESMNLMDLVQMFIVYAFIIAGALSAVFIFFGGISFILSGGDDAKIKQAVNTIRYSIIGLIVTILSFWVVVIVGKIFGFRLMDYVSYSKIIESVKKLTSTAQNNSGSGDYQDFQIRQ